MSQQVLAAFLAQGQEVTQQAGAGGPHRVSSIAKTAILASLQDGRGTGDAGWGIAGWAH